MSHFTLPLPVDVLRAGCGLALVLSYGLAHAAGTDIVGRYVAKDAEFVIEKGQGTEYKMQYFGKCLRDGEPFEFYTNGKARRLGPKSFAISVVTSRVPSCARFAPLDGQDLWRFKKTEPTWLTKQNFLREK
jgi:hypothetical protein